MKRMTSRAKLHRARQRLGSTMVEFALTLPLLALMLFGIIQYGFIFAAYMTLRNASAVGARYATLGTSPKPTKQQITDVTIGAITPMLKTNGATVNVGTPTVGGQSATSVQINYNLQLIIPFVVPGKTSGDSLALSATSVMR
jgi:Flp pilus assembly protein TadG